MHKISLDLTKTVNGTDVPLTLVAAMRNAIERGFTMADLVFNLTERGYDMVLVPKGMKNGMLVPLSPNELVQRIQKHQSGTHDQQSHGNWAEGKIDDSRIDFDFGGDSVARGEYKGFYTIYVDNEKAGRLDYLVENNKNLVTLDMIDVKPKWQRRGLATKLIDRLVADHTQFGKPVPKFTYGYLSQEGADFLRSLHEKYTIVNPMGRTWGDRGAPLSLEKHQAGTHDQLSHGNWADKLSGTRTGGNRLELYDSLELQKGQPDSQQTAVYEAQADAFSYNDIPRPFFNNNRGEYGSTKEYDDAYKKYSKEFTAWQRATTKNIESPLGKEYLNGTPAGVKKYVKEVITQDWFVESFGKGLFFPNLEIIVNDASVKTSASYFRQYNTLSEASRHGIRVYRGFTQDERLLLHEIAHYATAISATEPHQPHGREWAGNYLYILQNTMGEKTVDTLRKEFDKKGVKYTND